MNMQVRAMWIAVAILSSGLMGFGLQLILPAQEIANGKGMVGLVAGLVALLLALVLGLVIWTSYGVYNTQVAEALSLGPMVMQLDHALEQLGTPGVGGANCSRRRSQIIEIGFGATPKQREPRPATPSRAHILAI